MAFEQRDMSGALFVNDKKTTDQHPNLNGYLVINGVKYWLSAWKKAGKEGKKDWLSLSASLPQESQLPRHETENEKPQTEDDSEIPF